MTIEGGEPVYVDDGGNVVCAKRHTRSGGAIMAYLDSVNFSSQAMGGGFMQILTASQIQHVRAVEQLLKEFES